LGQNSRCFCFHREMTTTKREKDKEPKRLTSFLELSSVTPRLKAAFTPPNPHCEAAHDTQHNNTKHVDIQHNNKKCNTQHNYIKCL
jgi:hypothetical protein